MFSLLVFWIFAVPAWSWNFRVHAVIVQMAAESIPSKKRDEYNADAQALMKRLDTVRRNEINTFKRVSDFAKTAFLMDEWRMKELATWFRKYDAEVPEPLLKRRG